MSSSVIPSYKQPTTKNTLSYSDENKSYWKVCARKLRIFQFNTISNFKELSADLQDTLSIEKYHNANMLSTCNSNQYKLLYYFIR
ncbi:hypothetical protein B1L02_03100 [Pseudoalteromonas piscicida]|uniref:Uncharacterized protein n=1 Tax=Pseudoalteromonas piscicida TaxID=43662 RepID=A0AAD0RI39_PSEO7|nr:hypothetical protein B1L02_03100 [Pseudoalteromonas piscicida]AXQ97042.1 hypothetical protein D0N37_04145 [Pseudoalteromonas piscicida]AXR03177.1 hypothetical protein D0511_14660 [Pseudoalteromonas piscicida]